MQRGRLTRTGCLATRHRKKLESQAHAGLVRSQRAGRERIWEMQTVRLAEARRYIDQISAQWDSAIERLRALVEDD